MVSFDGVDGRLTDSVSVSRRSETLPWPTVATTSSPVMWRVRTDALGGEPGDAGSHQSDGVQPIPASEKFFLLGCSERLGGWAANHSHPALWSVAVKSLNLVSGLRGRATSRLLRRIGEARCVAV